MVATSPPLLEAECIHTEGETLEELRANVREAVDCYFDDSMEAPKIIRLHFVRDEAITITRCDCLESP
jgi:predicted RNase H-like HicB family nuclease